VICQDGYKQLERFPLSARLCARGGLPQNNSMFDWRAVIFRRRRVGRPSSDMKVPAGGRE